MICKWYTKRSLNTYLFVSMCSQEIDRFLINLIRMKIFFIKFLLQPFVLDIHEVLTNALSFRYVCEFTLNMRYVREFTLNMRFLLISYQKSTVLLRPVRLCLCLFDTTPILISYKKSTVLLTPVWLCLCPFDISPILISYKRVLSFWDLSDYVSVLY